MAVVPGWSESSLRRAAGARVQVLPCAGGQAVGVAQAFREVTAGSVSGLVYVEPTGKMHYCVEDSTTFFLNSVCVDWSGSRDRFDYADDERVEAECVSVSLG